MRPGELAPDFRLTSAGSGRRFSLEGCAGRKLVLVFHSEDTAEEAREINLAVRERYPSPEEVVLVSVMDLSLVPPPFWGGAALALDGAYREAAGEITEGADPAEYVVILPDYSGLTTRRYGVRDTSQHAAIVVVSAAGFIKGRHQGKNSAEATLELLE